MLRQRARFEFLEEDQRQLLESINFVSTPSLTKQSRNEQWDANFAKIQKIYSETGGVKINVETSKPLSKWWYTQKLYLRANQLSDEREKKMKSIGADVLSVKKIRARGTPKKNEERWQSQFEKLKTYRESHGDCNVPMYWEEDKSLSLWVHSQRRFYRESTLGVSKMDPVRIAKLEELGMEWHRYRKADNMTSDTNDSSDELFEKCVMD